MLAKSWRILPLVLSGLLVLGCGEKPGGATDVDSPVAGAVDVAAKAGASPKAVKASVSIDSLYLPDADVFISAKPSEFFGSAVVQAITESVMALPMFQFGEQKTVDQMAEENLGVKASSFDRLVVTLNTGDETGLGILVHSSPIKAAVLAKVREQAEVVSKSHQGVEFFAGEDPDEGPAIAFLQDNLTIIGTEESVVSAIGRFKSGAKSSLPAELSSLAQKAPAGASLVVAVIPTEEMLSSAPVGADARDVKAFVLGLSTGAVLDVWAMVAVTDDTTGASYRQTGLEQMEQAKAQFGPMVDMMPDLAPFKKLIDSVSIAGSGSEVTFTATVTSEVIDAAPMLMGMFMGGMGGMGGPQGSQDFDFDFDDFDFE